ncbi:response regulator transcription factor [Streptomyces sp. SS7]|uniref:response regulator transcription factor n=1 Tax=Streptomyces sp. SS7 TaxID=3108485 RepID=UPI0030EBACCA
MLRVLIVDDQELVRTGFRMILEARDDFDVVGEASDGGQAIALSETLRPDVVVMDIRMPVVNGIDATRAIAASGAATKILVLTTFDTDENVHAAIQAGASGFLLKDTRADQFADAVRTVAAGHAVIAPTATKRLLDHVARTAPPGAPRNLDRLDVLTRREREVLVHVAEGRSNAQIAAELHLSETTIKTYVSAILHKLHLRDRIHAVITAYDCGLVPTNR